MRNIIKGLALAALLGGTAQAGQGDTLVPFDRFVKDVESKPLSSLQGLAGTKVRDEKAFEEMRQHVLSLYQGVRVGHSFELDKQVFDCVPIASQPSVRQLGIKEVATPPTVAPPAGRPDAEPSERLVSPLQRGLTDRFGNAVRCDSGTIPMLRVTLETVGRFESLQQFFSKGPDGAGRPPSQNIGTRAVAHKYAYTYQYVNNYGGNSWLNLWTPSVNTGANQIFSLSQHWYVGGSGASTQTVEGGWQAYPALYGTPNSALFIYWTANNYASTGCYNLSCAAFVQTNPGWALGGTFGSYSTIGGTQYEFQMQWKYSGGNWWLFLQGGGTFDAVGYYPGTLFGGGQLASYATLIEYGGETVGDGNYPPMGSGAWPGGFGTAAYQRYIYYTDLGNVGQWANLTPAIPSPSCYSLTYTPASSGGSWGTYFFYGGPGGTGC